MCLKSVKKDYVCKEMGVFRRTGASRNAMATVQQLTEVLKTDDKNPTSAN